MKILNLFEEVLVETLNIEEYHYSGYIYEILKSDEINLSSGLVTKADRIGGKFFFLSLSRTPSLKLGFIDKAAANRGSVARIVFDGRKLNSDFSSIPVDYWGDKARRFEYEDRIVTDKPVIKGIKKYILRVEIITSKVESYPYYKKVIELCEDIGIACFAYANESDLRLKRNLINNEILDNDAGITNDYIPSFREGPYDYLLAFLFIDKKYQNDSGSLRHDIEYFIIKHDLEEQKIDIDKVKEIINRLFWSDRDVISVIEAKMHTYFKHGGGGKFRVILNILIKMMRKLGVSDLTGLINIKLKGIKTKTNFDWMGKYCLWKYDNDLDGYVMVDNNTQLTELRDIYFNTYKYAGYLDDDDYKKMYEIKKDGGAVGSFLNYLLNKYTINKVDEIIRNSGYNNGNETYFYKLDKIK
jgi:hypothetical protein